jgi:type IV secretion system protein VirB10
MKKGLVFLCGLTAAAGLAAQTRVEPVAPGTTPDGLKTRDQNRAPGQYQIDAGTHVLLNVVKSVSTKQSLPGDRIYLETAFPVVSGNRIVVPQGSWVTGTILNVKKPGRGHGRGELQVRFDSIVLLNGVTRNFRGDLGGLDASNEGTLKREESTVKGPGDKKGDIGTVVGTTAAGSAIGTGIGAATGHIGGGSLIGLGGGAAAGLIGVLLTRGPDATLLRGSTVEMVLDRALTFSAADLDFSNAPPSRPLAEGAAAQAQKNNNLSPRYPF